MQNSHPSRTPFSSFLLQELLQRTLLGARPDSASTAPMPSDPPGADADFAHGDDPADDDTPLGADAADDTRDPDDARSRRLLAELLGVLRDPITWVFSLAERHADGDPVDIAAIHRVRDEVLHHLSATLEGAPPDAGSPRLRSADLLIVGSHLIGTLDPRFVQRVTQIVGMHLAEVFSAGLRLGPTLVDLRRADASCPGGDARPDTPPVYAGAATPHPIAPCGCSAAMPHLAFPYAGHLSGPFALRPVVPPWYWPHAPVSF